MRRVLSRAARRSPARRSRRWWSSRRTPPHGCPSRSRRTRTSRRTEPRPEIGRLDLEECLGLGEPGQRVPAEAVDPDAVGELQAIAGGRGEQDLPAVSRGADPRGGMDRDADVARLGELRTAGVDSDPDAYRRSAGPGSLAERSLDPKRRVDRGPRLREDGEELSGPRVDLPAAGLTDAGPD